MAVAASAGYVLASLSINGKSKNAGANSDLSRKRPKTLLERELERRERRKRHGCRHCRHLHRVKGGGEQVVIATDDPRLLRVVCVQCGKVLATNVPKQPPKEEEDLDGEGFPPFEEKEKEVVFVRSCCADFRGRYSKVSLNIFIK